MGLAGQVARGAGVDLDVGSLVGKVVAHQQAATRVANSGYLEGEKGAAGVRQDPSAVLADAQKAADTAAISTDTALEGLQRFVGKTSDLETGRALLERMAVLSKSTGSSMEDVGDAAGSIAVKMGDIPDKANAVASIMSVIAKQGKIGAVEMSTMAKQISGFIGPANQFAEGTGKAVVELGALFQITNKFGGVKGPAQAATSVSSFASDLTSKSGLKALTKSGISLDKIFADKGRTKLRNLDEILPTLLQNAGGDLTKLAAEMPNKRSGSVLKAFGQVYNDAEAQKKGSGASAVKDIIGKYSGATSDKDTTDALARALDTTESKVQRFNNQLEKIAEESSAKVLPALEKLGPSLISAADSAGKIAGWAAENPYQAVGAAAAVSIGKEIAGAGLKSIMSTALSSSMAGPAGIALGIGVATIAIESAVLDMREKAQDATADAEVRAQNAGAKIKGEAKAGVVGAEDLKAAEEEQKQLQARIAAAQAPPSASAFSGSPLLSGLGYLGGGIANYASGGAVGESFGSQAQKSADAANIESLKAANEKLSARIGDVHKALTSGVLKVQVMNPQGGGALAGPGPGATTGPGPLR